MYFKKLPTMFITHSKHFLESLTKIRDAFRTAVVSNWNAGEYHKKDFEESIRHFHGYTVTLSNYLD